MMRLLLLTFAAMVLIRPAYSQDTLQNDPQVAEFIAEMGQKYTIPEDWLHRYLDPIEPNETVLNAILPPTTPAQRSWQAYRARFNKRIVGGLEFWRKNQAALERAERIYGVPPEIIVAIIGVETVYGRNMGRFSVLRSLATLAFRYPPRAPFFRDELEQYLLLCREMHFDPAGLRGSYAGAIGIPQFMPGSIRRYAVDFDGDGQIDLSGNPVDAIGSVANFLVQHGWVKNGPISERAVVTGNPEPLIAAGILPVLTLREMAEAGVTPKSSTLAGKDELAALIDLPDVDYATEYWLGYQNFYVITRYNRSTFYAMAVFELAQSIREARAITTKTVKKPKSAVKTGKSSKTKNKRSKRSG